MEAIKKATLLVLIVSAGAGCSMIDSGGQAYVEARQIDDVPEDAPVIRSENETIRDVGPIQEVLEKATHRNESSVLVEISPAEAKETRNALESLPVYEGDPAGYYIRKDNQTYVITFLKQQ